MMIRINIMVLMLFLSMACQYGDKKNTPSSINLKPLKESSECSNALESFGISNNSLEEFINSINFRFSDNEKIILLLYSEEGEVINTYRSAFVFNNKNLDIATSVNNSELELKHIKNVNEKEFYDFFISIEDVNAPRMNKALVIDYNTSNSKCSFYRGIKSSSSTRIKELNIFTSH